MSELRTGARLHNAGTFHRGSASVMAALRSVVRRSFPRTRKAVLLLAAPNNLAAASLAGAGGRGGLLQREKQNRPPGAGQALGFRASVTVQVCSLILLASFCLSSWPCHISYSYVSHHIPPVLCLCHVFMQLV
ncbi:hypothetical protein SKAU_G00082370 [Synaphobranchus kaupii]|uniref:Uncharacterized protein n=1 Tax=Synaphobranchus kaupii TaxID=118154 RepID=A0A9Q1J5B7_SYNKA|nr:hypothetical protein SKAU_G00082370 [Synaphobranchus kaupii]